LSLGLDLDLVAGTGTGVGGFRVRWIWERRLASEVMEADGDESGEYWEAGVADIDRGFKGDMRKLC